MISIRRYRRVFLGTTLGLLSTVALLNFMIDPFWIHRGPWSSYHQPHWNQMSSRVAKSEVAARDPIQVALVGDSRVLGGLDPRHPSLTQQGSTYNFGMTSLTVDEALRLIEVLLHDNPAPPKLILWVIQPEFVVYDRRPQHHFDFRLSRLNSTHNTWTQLLHSLWSVEATSRSIHQINSRWQHEKPVLLGAEAIAPINPVVSLGQFQKHCHDLQQAYLQNTDIPAGVEMAERVGQVFQTCADQNIELKVIIPPSHAMYWDCLARMGWLDRVERGKRSLVQLADQANSAANHATVYVWDFSGFQGPVAESLPESDASVRWHTDAVHFTRALGDEIICRVLNEEHALPDFGCILTTQNVESHLTQWKSDWEDYTRAHAPRSQYAFERTSVRK